MPIYEYTCKDCSNEFETLVFSAEEKVECPQCESSSIEKQMSVPAAPKVKSLPTSCSTDGPICGPRCCRI